MVLALQPLNPLAYNNRGIVFKDLGRLAEALESYDMAISLKENYSDAFWNKGLARLLMGEFSEGWKLYAWRKKNLFVHDQEKQRPIWTGTEDLSKKTILVHWEQGFGDTIQFCRFLPGLRKMARKVLFAPQKRLMGLLKGLDRDLEIVDRDDPSLVFDFQIHLLSLPGLMMTSLDEVPCQHPYLFARQEKVNFWRERLGSHGLRIGVCWQGSTGEIDAGRSFGVSRFQHLARLPHVRLISLHKGDGEAQLAELPEGMKVESLGDAFDSGPDAFVDAAAAMMACDLVITSDTAIAHLAGALGVRTWVALKYVPDWRWFLNRADSPWYPSARLFRQKHVGDWDSVFMEIQDAFLREFL